MLCWALLGIAGARCSSGESPPAGAERGAFTLFKFAKAIGRETYTLDPRGDGSFELKDDFAFTDRGTRVPLKTVLLADGDLRPLTFATDGSSSRSSDLHDTVEIAKDGVRVTRNNVSTMEAKPEGNFFVIDGYSPVAMQELLLRFWQRRGQPAEIPLLPAGLARIRPGVKLMVAGRSAGSKIVTGYTVSGLIWGQESLWMDAAGQLVALVSTDAEFDHFEAVREGYEASLPLFIREAARSNLKVMAGLAAGAGQRPARRLAIVGGTLIDGRGGPPLPDATVLVEGERIVAVGAAKGVRLPKGTTVLDARGKWILPGLWDMHAHFEQVEWGPVYLASGVTTVRDCGNEFDYITAVRDALAARQGVGPEILIAGLVDGSGPGSLGVITADSPEEARAVVDRYKAAGALQIKLYSSVKPKLVPVFAAEAHRLGMTVTGHVPNGMTTTEAVQAGMDQISHISYPEAEFAGNRKGTMPRADFAPDFSSPRSLAILATLREHHTVFDPTVALFELQNHPERVPVESFEPGVRKVAPQLAYGLTHGGVSPKYEASVAAWQRALLATVGALHSGGLSIVAGTDQAVPGYSLHRELELYVKAGLSPMEAIQSATSVPARAMRMELEAGTVEAGRRADLLLLNADPLADIRATREVWRTIKAGAVYEPGPLWKSVDFQP